MKNFRLRLTVFILAVIAGGSVLGIVFSTLYRMKILGFHDRSDELVVSYLIRDILFFVLSLAIIIFLTLLMSKITAKPVESLSKGMNEIAKGNYDVKVNIKRKTEIYANLAENFNKMASELKANEYLTKSFSSNVSHEFKTPISIINGYAGLLRDPDLDEESKEEYLDYIIRETTRLSQMTDNLLTISRIDSDSIRSERSSFALDEQIRQSVLGLEPIWEKKKIQIEPDLSPVTITACENMLEHVWYNLIENAVKFTPENGKIQIDLMQSGDLCEVRITDSGIGMSKETAEKAFTQFFRGDNSGSESGSGLGLPLVKRICEYHNGQIKIESVLGKGTTIHVLLPLQS